MSLARRTFIAGTAALAAIGPTAAGAAITRQEAHTASLSLPSVRDAITKGRPLIAGMERVTETVPVGGSGLATAA